MILVNPNIFSIFASEINKELAINNLNNVAMANTRSREIAEINKNDYFVMKKITRE